MGKEAKIGLSIIGVLVIIFAIVLGQKLLTSKDDSKVAKEEKPPQSKKENGKKPHRTKKNRFDLFDTKHKKKTGSTSSNSKGKATSALPISQSSPGISSLTNNKTNWGKRYGNSTVSSSPMPNTEGSTKLQAQAGTDNSAYQAYPSSYPTYSAQNVSQTNDTNTKTTTTDPSPSYSSPEYQSYSSPGSNSHYSKVGHSNTNPTDTTQTNTDQYGSHRTNAYKQKHHSRRSQDTGYRQTQDTKYGQSGYSPSSSYPSESSSGYPSRHASASPEYKPEYKCDNKTDTYDSSNYRQDPYKDQDSRYRSASYAKKEYPSYKSHDYGTYKKPAYSGSESYRGSESYGHSEYGGGPRSDGTYVVKPHQTYSSISKEIYGIEAYFKALAEANRSSIPDENRLQVGDRIKTPDVAKLQQKYPDLCPSPKRLAAMRRRSEIVEISPRYGGSGQQYIVQSGDTLYDIARFELGDAARWTEIYKLNRQILKDSFDYLTPGLKLEMPNKEGKAATSETVYDPSSRHENTSSKYEDYRQETPRTATRPGGYHRPSPTYRPSSRYGY